MLHYIGKRIIGNGIKPSSAQSYFRRLIKRVNGEEEGEEGQKQRTITGMINVLGLSQNN